MLTFLNGDLFTSKAQVIVNTVNCVGAMGAGIALGFKNRYPKMFEQYREECKKGLYKTGNLYTYQENGSTILNFPTKDHWKDPSEYAYLESGLASLRKYLVDNKIKSIAIPALGSTNGGLDWVKVQKMIFDALKDLPVAIEVYLPQSKIFAEEDLLQLIALRCDVKRHTFKPGENLPTVLPKALEFAEQALNTARRRGWLVLPYNNPLYPKKLLRLNSPPPVVYCRGNVDILAKETSVAIIGSRDATPTSMKLGQYLGELFSQQDIPVVSGLALGCDTAAHVGALKGKGGTIAVMAAGLEDRLVYPPQNAQLAKKILDNGIWLTEYPPGTKLTKRQFVERDFIQAGLADATILVQSGLNGGSMYASKACLDLKRPLAVCARGNKEDDKSLFAANEKFYMENRATLLWKKEDYQRFLNRVLQNTKKEHETNLHYGSEDIAPEA